MTTAAPPTKFETTAPTGRPAACASAARTLARRRGLSRSPSVTARLRRWLEPLGDDLPPLFLVGGAVRDRLLGLPSRDLDLIGPRPEALARRLGRVHQATVVSFLKKAATPCHRVVSRDDPEDFLDLAPVAGGKVEADLARRDFTVNAMALPILPGGRYGPVVDPLDGRRDLAARIIRACGPDVFGADPVRVLRAVRLAACSGFAIEPATLAAARRAAPGLTSVAVERCVKELFELLGRPAAAHLRVLDGLGALEAVVPEITVRRNPRGLVLLERLEALLAEPGACFGTAAEALAALLAARNRKAVLKLACLLHGIAEAVQAETLARRLKLSARDRRLLVALVSRPPGAAARSGPETLMQQGRRLGHDLALSILLGMAAHGSATAADRRRCLRQGRADLATCFDIVLPALAARPLITGDDLLAAGWAPGPRIGRILARVAAARDAGRITTRREALEMARTAAAQYD